MDAEVAARLRELQRQRNDAEDRCVMLSGVIGKLMAELKEKEKDAQAPSNPGHAV